VYVEGSLLTFRVVVEKRQVNPIEALHIKATGACGLLSAYSGTQSGKLLGGKLAGK